MSDAVIAAQPRAMQRARRECRRRAGPSGRRTSAARRQDRRRRQQEGEAGGVGVVEPAHEAGRSCTTPSRLIPAISAVVCAVPITPASGTRASRGGGRRRPSRPSRTASERTSARRRKRSAPSRMKPLTTRKIDAASGLASATRTGCSSSKPEDPDRNRRDDDQPCEALGRRLDPSLGERREEGADHARSRFARSRSAARRRCRRGASRRTPATATRARDCQLTMLCQPNRLGKITVWPRLEIGNSSVTPCRTPSTIAWKVVIRWRAQHGGNSSGSIVRVPDSYPTILLRAASAPRARGSLSDALDDDRRAAATRDRRRPRGGPRHRARPPARRRRTGCDRGTQRARSASRSIAPTSIPGSV